MLIRKMRYKKMRYGLGINSERGQAMTEYIILVILVGLVCITVAESLPRAVRGYVLPFYYCVSRPFP